MGDKKTYQVAIMANYLEGNLRNLDGKKSTSLMDRDEFNKNIFKPDIYQTNDDNVVHIMPHANLINLKWKKADMAITGSDSYRERDVRNFRGNGLVIGRYSMFYGKPSKYSGMRPGDSGYALDIPKEPHIVRSLLKFDPVLDAIVNKDSDGVRSALDELNKYIGIPILATPYLDEALERKDK